MFKKRFNKCLLSGLILLAQSQSFVWADEIQNINEAQASTSPSGDDSAADAKYAGDLSTLENKLFSHDYANESIQTRLDRMERLIYGAAKTGSTQSRMNELLTDVHMQAPQAAAAAPEVTSQSSDQSSSYSPSNQSTTYPPSNQSTTYPPGNQSTTYPPGNQSTAYPPSNQYAGYPPNSQDTGYPSSNQSQYPPNSQTAGYPPVSQTSEYQQNSQYPQNNAYPSNQTQTNEANKQTASYPPSANYPQSQPMTGQAVIKGPQSPPSLKAEVQSMEMQVYGKTYTDSLNNRVLRLEQSVFATQPAKHFAPLPTRVNKLMEALQPAFAHPQDLYDGKPVLSSSKNSKTSDEEKQKHGHPFLKKLGQELGRTALMAGGMAGGVALGNMMSGGYGGGYGNGYGGYSGNYGGFGSYTGFGGNPGLGWR